MSNSSKPRPTSKVSPKSAPTYEIDAIMDHMATTIFKDNTPRAGTSQASSAQTEEPAAEEPQEEIQPQNEMVPPAAKKNGIKSILTKNYFAMGCHRLSVKSSRNNMIITLAEPKGKIVFRTSGGQMGFKGANRASYECGYACATSALDKISKLMEEQPVDLHVFLNGFGQGREAIYRSLVASDNKRIKECVRFLTDNTPLKIGGTRPKKARRL